MEIPRSLIDSPIDALKAAVQAVRDAQDALREGRCSEAEYNDLIATATDLEAIDAAMLDLEEKQALQDGIKALIAIAQNIPSV